MEYVDLENYATRMQELTKFQPEMKPHRLRAEQSKLMYDMLRILKPSLHRLTSRKHMTVALRDEIEQHAAIAITRAIEDWDSEKATFSTYVHWKIMAELQTLQWVEFPERRKLMLQQPLRFLELDRPMRGSEGDDDFTLGQTLISANGEEDVESNAREHIAMHCFERVFSHYISKQMQAYRANQNDQQKIEIKQSGLMRNRWIYICRVIHMETYETIAKRHDITRERIRQVIKEIDDDLRGQLPRYCKKSDSVIHATRMPPEDLHEDWDGMLISFYMETGIDSRLINRDSELPTRPVAEVVETVKVTVEEISDEQAVNDRVNENHVDAAPANNVVELVRRRPQQLSLFQGAGLAIAAGATMMSAAANAQSRALPPAAAIEASETATKRSADLPKVSRILPKTPTRKMTRTFSPQALDKIVTARPAWGVGMGSYPKLDALRTDAIKQQRTWPWLNGLTVAYSQKGSDQYRAVFGPLTKEQANGLCHEAKRHERTCTVMNYGSAKL